MRAMLPFVGSTVIEVKIEDCTLRVVLPVTELEVAEIVRVPSATVVTTPLPLIDATLELEELQVTDWVISFVL
jgi:hypothetical protein